METGIERVKEDDAASGKQSGHQLSERRAVGFASRIGFAERAGEDFGERAFERLRRGGYERLDRIAEDNFSDVAAGVLLICGQFVAGDAVARVPKRMIDLGEIVILGREPENRNGVDAAARGFLRAADGRESLVKGVRGTGKETDLLAGHDRDGAGGETVEIVRGRGIELASRSESLVLLAQNFHDASARGGIEAYFMCGGINTGSGGRMRVIGGNTGKIFEEGREELRGVRDFAKRNTVGLHRGSHDTRAPQQRQLRGNVGIIPV